MRAALCILCAALLAIGGCDSQEAEHKRAERQARDEQDAKREAEKQARREAELALMSDPNQGPAELERRLMEWIDVKAGIATFTERRGKSFVIRASPATTPWLVTCDNGIVDVKFGEWTEVSDGSSEHVLQKELTIGRLTEEQCRPLIEAVARKLRSMISHPDAR